MILYIFQINCLFRFCRNRGNLGLFGHGSLLCCHNGEQIQGQILLTAILKPQQEPSKTIYCLHQKITLLPHPHGKSFSKLILQLTYLFLHNCSHHYLVSPTPAPPLYGVVVGTNKISNKRSVNGQLITSSGAVLKYFSVFGFCVRVFDHNKSKTKKHNCFHKYFSGD